MIRLSRLEEDIMDTLWKLEKAFPKVLITYLSKPIPPYNTVLSSIRKLEKLGYVGYTRYGKSHEYYPILKKEEYSQSLFKKLFHDLVGGSKETLVSYFLKAEDMNITELEEIIEKLKSQENDS